MRERRIEFNICIDCVLRYAFTYLKAFMLEPPNRLRTTSISACAGVKMRTKNNFSERAHRNCYRYLIQFPKNYFIDSRQKNWLTEGKK